MQIAQAVYRAFSGKEGAKIQLSGMKLEFGSEDRRKEDSSAMTAKEYSEKAKTRWFSMLGMKMDER